MLQMILRDIIEKSSHQYNFCISFFYTVALDASSQMDKHLTGPGTKSYVKALHANYWNPVKGNLMAYSSSSNYCQYKMFR